MKAVKYKGVKSLELVDIAVPKANADEVLVKVKYCGICGTDIHAYNHPGIFDWELILGHESVGFVEEVGENIDWLKKGDRVAVGPPGDCGECYACNTGRPNICSNAFPNTLGIGPGTQGAYAEYVLSKFPKNELFLIPEDVTFEQAVLFDVIGVGFHAVRRSEFKVGDNVIVSGCGSIGLSVIQTLKLGGAGVIVAFDTNENRRQTALLAGADYAYDPRDEKYIDEIKDIFSTTKGATVSFEAAGNVSSVENCVKNTMPGGQIMLIGSDGAPYGLVTATLGPMELDFKLSFTYTKEEIVKLFELISLGKIDTSIYKLEKAKLEDAEEMIIKQSRPDTDIARVLLEP